MELVNRIPGQIVRAFEVGATALFLADKQKVYRSGPVVPQLDTESLKAILARDEPVIDVANSVCFLPVRMGLHPVGSLGISGTVLSRQTLEAIATLIAVAMEHARAVEQVGQTEAPARRKSFAPRCSTQSRMRCARRLLPSKLR